MTVSSRTFGWIWTTCSSFRCFDPWYSRPSARQATPATWRSRSSTPRASGAISISRKVPSGSFHSAIVRDGGWPSAWLRRTMPSDVKVSTDEPGSSASTHA